MNEVQKVRIAQLQLRADCIRTHIMGMAAENLCESYRGRGPRFGMLHFHVQADHLQMVGDKIQLELRKCE